MTTTHATRSIRNVLIVLLVLALVVPAATVSAGQPSDQEVPVGAAFTVAVGAASSIVFSAFSAPEGKNPNCRGIYSLRGNLLGCICKAPKALFWHPYHLSSCREY